MQAVSMTPSKGAWSPWLVGQLHSHCAI